MVWMICLKCDRWCLAYQVTCSDELVGRKTKRVIFLNELYYYKHKRYPAVFWALDRRGNNSLLMHSCAKTGIFILFLHWLNCCPLLVEVI